MADRSAQVSTAPLSILDLAPVSSGSSIGDALRNTIDLARQAEDLGYHRYWLAEHHFSPGAASSAPAVLAALVAAATRRIRVGAGGVQLGHRTSLSVVEEFGMIDALYPGRIDLGLGRTGHRRAALSTDSGAEVDAPGSGGSGAPARDTMVNGVLVPRGVFFSDFARFANLPQVASWASMLYQPGARAPDFAEHVRDILALLSGTYRTPDGFEAHAVPGEGAGLQVWILGSTGGQSARVAGENGLPFAVNYLFSPSTIFETVDAYRAAFRPTAARGTPYVIVSVSVTVARDDATARELAEPHGLWVRSLRTGTGFAPVLSPSDAAAHRWSDDERKLVADLVDTRFCGSPPVVVDKLRALRDATGADELLIATVTHDNKDRVRSFELLAEAWSAA